jgi:S-methylmethionine-dependent homocysteine/selenocysteine methylase
LQVQVDRAGLRRGRAVGVRRQRRRLLRALVVLVAEEARGAAKPLWLSFTLLDEDRSAAPQLRGGEPVAAAAAAAVRLGAAALLFNCAQPEVMLPAVVAARAALDAAGAAHVRVGAYANAFEPQRADATANDGFSALRDDLSPAAYRAAAQSWRDAGASIVGGCCGVGPDFIAALCEEAGLT